MPTVAVLKLADSPDTKKEGDETARPTPSPL